MTNKQSLSSHPSYLKDLILLFAIPIGIAVFAAAVVYVPRLFAHPAYDFIYSVCDGYGCNSRYSIDSSGYITQNTNQERRAYYNEVANLHYYDARNDSTRSLTLDEARKYRLDASSKSPDGYVVTREYSSSGFLFWGDYDDGWYIKDGMKKKKIALSVNDSYSSRDIKFLGWVNK